MGLKRPFTELLKNLLPKGRAWPRTEDTLLHSLMQAFADELQRVDDRAQDLLLETDPRSATELLSDWERVLALPDECTPDEGLTLSERRIQAGQKLSNLGGQTPAYFLGVVIALGIVNPTIIEFSPFQAGHSAAGDPLSNGPWVHTWEINSQDTQITYFRCGNSVSGDRLTEFGNRLLECVIERLKPAHTHVIYSFGG